MRYTFNGKFTFALSLFKVMCLSVSFPLYSFLNHRFCPTIRSPCIQLLYELHSSCCGFKSCD